MRPSEGTPIGFGGRLNMRITVEEKEIVVTIVPKISELSVSRDILDSESLRFAVVRIKD